MSKKEQWMLAVLAVLLIVFALVAWYLNVYYPSKLQMPSPAVGIQKREEPIKLNNTLKTSVTVLPAPEGTQPAPEAQPAPTPQP